jgi:hypothetical protein
VSNRKAGKPRGSVEIVVGAASTRPGRTSTAFCRGLAGARSEEHVDPDIHAPPDQEVLDATPVQPTGGVPHRQPITAENSQRNVPENEQLAIHRE